MVMHQYTGEDQDLFASGGHLPRTFPVAWRRFSAHDGLPTIRTHNIHPEHVFTSIAQCPDFPN